ncbi:MAG: hypothetical protein WC375_03380 [Methanomassiliicoccales archaeon]|jgi:hypothetical protein
MSEFQNTYSEQTMQRVYYTMDEVIELDRLLFQLASYEVNRGMISIPTDVQDVILAAQQIVRTFNYFKRLIQNGECTFDYIQNTVLLRNGPFSQHPKDNPVNSSEVITSNNQNERDVKDFAKVVEDAFGITQLPQSPIIGVSDEKNVKSQNDMLPKISTRQTKPKRKKINKGKRNSK